MIIAKTIKGKGVSFIENKNGWHGKTLNREGGQGPAGVGPGGSAVRGVVSRPEDLKPAEVEAPGCGAHWPTKRRFPGRPEGLRQRLKSGSIPSFPSW